MTLLVLQLHELSYVFGQQRLHPEETSNVQVVGEASLGDIFSPPNP